MWKYLFLLLVVITLAIFCKPVRAVNEYLNDYPNHCSKGSLELYTDITGRDDKYSYYDGDGDPNNHYRGYDDDVSGSVGIRYRWDLGSSCTDPYKRMMMENMELKQQLELLKLCGRYKELDLGANFATVREKCKDVNRKEEDAGTDNRTTEDSIRSGNHFN
jgi:hypothetical protein|tara:strand:+ start:1252 stop:1734 length:483 start_codon:yes stop_codon:yes gene_type:complete